MREQIRDSLGALEQSTGEQSKAEPANEAQLKLDLSMIVLNQSIDDAVDRLTAALQTRRDYLKQQVLSFAHDEKQEIVVRQSLLESKLKESIAFYEGSRIRLNDDDTPLTQTELFQVQSQCEKHTKENRELIVDTATPTEASVGLDTEAMALIIAEFGQMNVTPRTSEQGDAQAPGSNTTAETVTRPKERKPKHTYHSDAEVLLYGLKRHRKGRGRGKE